MGVGVGSSRSPFSVDAVVVVARLMQAVGGGEAGGFSVCRCDGGVRGRLIASSRGGGKQSVSMCVDVVVVVRITQVVGVGSRRFQCVSVWWWWVD